MLPAILFGILCLVALIGGLWYLAQTLRARGRAEIDKRFATSDVLLDETLAQSYGQQSRGVTQARGNGALALTRTELFFLLYVPERELRIPVASIVATSIVRSHLGKSGGAKLLHVRFESGGTEDAIAWRLPDPEAWQAKIQSLRG